ncbi:40S ribosomal protein S8-like [Hibiscus syriacus]|uniref:40S ribosomal protein S8-like n=1 Tax=Hibiscus syriacus TaxID=106335 RepID=UPI0019236B32|nr:40S ribosomal protein S8-like [Hibiscus syriacus]
MGISRDSMHKRRSTGGKKKAWRKKRKYELGRQPGNTKLSSNKTVRRIRTREGNTGAAKLAIQKNGFALLRYSDASKVQFEDYSNVNERGIISDNENVSCRGRFNSSGGGGTCDSGSWDRAINGNIEDFWS